jgi:EmrB/QacA subfamily drug resistance transporter
VPELTRRRRLTVLAVCCIALFIVMMDNTVVNVALPSIRKDLHASVAGLQWTLDAYLLVLASLLMLCGSLADRFGRRRTFQVGLVLFTAGSLLCSLAPTLGWLVGFRALQAVGGSMLSPVAMSIIANVFTDPRERAWAIGVWGAVSGVSMGLGPIVGGALIELANWRAIFWINIPIGLAAAVLAAVFVPESKALRPRRIDPIGQLLMIVALGALTHAIIEAPQAGWLSEQTTITAAVAVAAFVGLLGYEPRRADPLIEFRFFHSAPLSGATVVAVCSFGAFSGYLFLNTLYLQDVRGYSALLAGVCTLPVAVVTTLFAPISARLVGSRGSRVPLVTSGCAVFLAAVVLVGLTAGTPLWVLLASYVVFGVGFGLVNTPITNSAVSGMPNSQAGVAAAVASTSRQVGGALGVAVVGSLLNSGLHGPLDTGFPAASHPAWLAVAACGLVVIPIGFLVTGRWAARTTDRVATLFEEDRVPAAAAAIMLGPADLR